jgi:L,D-peptidoglycan transpeptidase YkuD (ErfK/YbiS/YcfS/YnhG family)
VRGGARGYRVAGSAVRAARAGVVLVLVAGVLGVAAPAAPRAAVPVPTAAVLPMVVADEDAEPVGRRPAVGEVPRMTTAPQPASIAAPSAPGPAATPEAEVSAAAPATLPLDVPAGGSGQVVTVVAASSRATTAQLTAWQAGPDGWTAVHGPWPARLGSAGVGAASEGSTRTPAGTFPLTEAFGRAADPGSGLPYRRVDEQDWWVSDVASPVYNQHARCAPGTCPFDEGAGENLLAAGAVYDHAVVIDYNRGGTPGAGSAFFLHVTNGAPTAGCVAIDRGRLQALLQWLDPAASPLIAIGVG